MTLRYARAAGGARERRPRPALLERVHRRRHRTPASGAVEQRAPPAIGTATTSSSCKADDPDLKMLAANAAYRAMRAQGGTWQAVDGRLDASPSATPTSCATHPTTRMPPTTTSSSCACAARSWRRASSRCRRRSRRRRPHRRTAQPADRPKDSDAKKFKMIVPMLPDERQEAEEAGRAAQKIRKG